MTATFSVLNESKITIFDKSFDIKDWEINHNVWVKTDEVFSFDLNINGIDYDFDVIFDMHGTCKWSVDRGDYFTPEFIEQEDIDLDISIKSIYSETMEISLIDNDVKIFIINLIKDSILKSV